MATCETYVFKSLLYYDNKVVGMRIELNDDIDGVSVFDLPLSMMEKYKIPWCEYDSQSKLNLREINGVLRSDEGERIPELTDKTKGFKPKMLWYCDEFGYSEYFTCADIEDCSECPLEGNSEGYCGGMGYEGVCVDFGDKYADTLVGNIEGVLSHNRYEAEEYYERQREEERKREEKKKEQADKRRRANLANMDINNEIKRLKKVISALESQKTIIKSHLVVNAMFNGNEIKDSNNDTVEIDKKIDEINKKIDELVKQRKARNKERRQK